jgi:hypothetical protein
LAVFIFWGNTEEELTAKKTTETANKIETESDEAQILDHNKAKGKVPDSEISKEGAPDSPAPSPHGKVVRIETSQGKNQKQSQSEVQVQVQGPAREEQKARKRPYGVSKSLDAVLRSDETIKIGDKEVSIAELERKLIVEQRGEVIDKPLGKKPRITAWGVHMVRPGENLWDIHFMLLKEYMASRGVKLAENADHPTQNGYSTGVGKVLKFAEHMVGVFNMKTRHMDSNLDLLEPGAKIVIYNLSEIFDQLAKIDPHDLSGVMYDGRVLLFPESQKAEPGGPTGSKKE